MSDDFAWDTTRRDFLRLAAGAALISVLAPSHARATPDAMESAIRAVTGDAKLQKGRIKLDLPPLVENGNSAPLTLSVESPMTEADHVKAIHVFNEKNPQPQVITVRLTPRAGKAQIATRIKLADSQRIVAIAELSDGTFWTDSADVIVTIAACIEDVN